MYNLKEMNESYVFIHYRLDRTFNLLLSSKYLSVFKGVIKRVIYYYSIRYDMKLEKDDFGIWDNDDEELSIIKEGYKSKEIADYILWLQEQVAKHEGE